MLITAARLPPRMRRFAVLALVLPVLAGGCGGDKDAGSALDEGLRYLPADAPFAVAIDTDVEGDQYKAAGRIARKFPFGNQVDKQLEQLFQRGGDVDFERDVKPLLGNPFVVGAVDARAFGSSGEDSSFVAAIRAKDGDKLKELVKKNRADEKGEKEGATIYEDNSGDTFAVKDDVLVVAGSRKLLEDALERRNGDDTLDEDKFDSALARLPREALIRSYFNLRSLINASSGGRQASKVKWVGALRTLGLTGSAEDDAISIDFSLKTDSGELSEDDLPIAGGGDAPGVVQRQNELGIGVRDPGQVVEFALDAGRAVEGGSVDAGKRQIERQLGIDVEDDLTNQLSGDTSINVSPTGRFGVRAELKDPAAFKRTLAKLADRLPRLAESFGGGPFALDKPKGGEPFYALAQPDGESVVFGVVGDALVIANEPARAARLAREKPTAVRGAQGSLVLSADAEKLADALLDRLSSQIGLTGALGARLFTGPLGDLTGAVESSTSGLKGRLELTFD